MYLSFYGLKKEPFQINADPSFLWLGEKHREALAILRYGVLKNKGCILLTGDVGTGKTTLINALINSLDDEVIVARVPDPGMGILDFMNYISHEFEMEKKFSSKEAFLIDFSHFLKCAQTSGKKTLLIIDEAQRLKGELLEEVRQLSNIEKQDTKLLNILFVGQHEFNDVLLENNNRALRQRIAFNYDIDCLDLSETGDLIRHRLKIAGAESDIFSSDAISQVFKFSGGFPRTINIICDHCLLSGFVLEQKIVSGKMVKKCAKGLLLPISSKNNSNESQESIEFADSENFKEIPAEHHHKGSSRSGWKMVSVVAVIVTALFTLSYLKYTGEYQNFVSRFGADEVQVSSGERRADTLIAKNYQEPDQEKILAEGFNTVPEIRAAGEGDEEVAFVSEPAVLESDEAVAVVLGEVISENLDPSHVVPDLPGEGSAVPPAKGEDDIAIISLDSTHVTSPSDLDQQIYSSEELKQEIPAVSETDVVEKVPAEANFDQSENAGGFDQQSKSVLAIESPEKAVKKIESNELPEFQISSANQEEVATAESADAAAVPIFEERVNHIIIVKPVNVVEKDESEVVFTETPTDSVQLEEIPETKRVEEPVVILEDADTQVVQPFSVSRKIETDNKEKEENQPASAPAELLISEAVVVQDNREEVEAELTSEAQSHPFDPADEEVNTISATESMDSDASNKISTEIVEIEIYDAVEVDEIEGDAVQALTNVQVLEQEVPVDAVEPIESTEDNEELVEDPDPGALIDWVIKKRSK